MTEDKAYKLLHAIDERTADGAIAWTETADEGSFLASFPKYSIIVRATRFENRLGDTIDGAEIDVIDNNGRIMDTVFPHRLDSTYSDPVDVAMRIYGRAKDIALGVDAAVDELLKELTPDAKKQAVDDGVNEEEIPF